MNKSGGLECIAWTWGIAALVGVFTASGLWTVGGWTFMQGAFMGVLALLVLGAVLTVMMCRPAAPIAQPGKTGASSAASSGAVTAKKGAPAAAAAQQASAAKMSAAEATAEPEAEVLPVDAPPQVVAEAEPEVTPGDDPAPLDDAGAIPDSPEVLEPESPTPVAPETAPAEGGTRPAALDGPRADGADDLKRIKGVGPALEKVCNDLGFYHFDQIAGWTADEVAWVDENLQGFKGRVTRDGWVEQARLLAAGGETEFSKKVDDGDVY